jgi:hypothetical protein
MLEPHERRPRLVANFRASPPRPFGGYGYDAVVRAVAGGQLRLVEYRKLEFDTLLTRAPKGKAWVLRAQLSTMARVFRAADDCRATLRCTSAAH